MSHVACPQQMKDNFTQRFAAEPGCVISLIIILYMFQRGI